MSEKDDLFDGVGETETTSQRNVLVNTSNISIYHKLAKDPVNEAAFQGICRSLNYDDYLNFVSKYPEPMAVVGVDAYVILSDVFNTDLDNNIGLGEEIENTRIMYAQLTGVFHEAFKEAKAKGISIKSLHWFLSEVERDTLVK